MTQRLNITNGDSAAGTLSEAGVEGGWRWDPAERQLVRVKRPAAPSRSSRKKK